MAQPSLFTRSVNSMLLLLAMLAAPTGYADTEECDPAKTFIYGCEPIEPLYQVRVLLQPTHGPITLGYRQTPYPPGMAPTGGKGSCHFKKSYETTFSATSSVVSESIAYAGIGSELIVTNLGPRPVKVELTGSPAGEPLAKGETKKFSLTTAEEDSKLTVSLPLWKIWQLPEKRKGKVICARESKNEKLKAQVVTLKAQTEEPGLWEQVPATEAPPPVPTVLEPAK